MPNSITTPKKSSTYEKHFFSIEEKEEDFNNDVNYNLIPNKSYLLAYTIVQYLPFLGEKISEGYYQVISHISEDNIKIYINQILLFFTSQNEVKLLSQLAVKKLIDKYGSELKKPKLVKNWIDKIVLLGIMLEVDIFRIPGVKEDFNTPAK